VRLQQQHQQSDGLFLGFCAGVWVAEPISERVGERVIVPVFFAIVEQPAAADVSSSAANVSSSAADVGFRRVVYGYCERLLRA
jgi:hypothetical protein